MSGQLGRRLLLYVEDIMHTGGQVPLVSGGASLQEVLLEMTSKGLGMTGIADRENHLCGIYTDGDLRCTLNKGINVYTAKSTEVMTRNPKTIRAGRLAAEAAQLMRQRKVNALYVMDQENRVFGALNMHDVLKAQFV